MPCDYRKLAQHLDAVAVELELAAEEIVSTEDREAYDLFQELDSIRCALSRFRVNVDRGVAAEMGREAATDRPASIEEMERTLEVERQKGNPCVPALEKVLERRRRLSPPTSS